MRVAPTGAPVDTDDTAVMAQGGVSMKQIATELGDWAASLRRRLQAPRR